MTLEKTNTQVEFTVTERAVYFRLAYPKTGERHMVVRVEGKGMLSADPAHSALSGFEDTPGARQYFYAESSRPFTVWGAWEGSKVSPGLATETGTNIGVAVTFPDSEANPSNGAWAFPTSASSRRAGMCRSKFRLELCRGQEPGAQRVESSPGKNCRERRQRR